MRVSNKLYSNGLEFFFNVIDYFFNLSNNTNVKDNISVVVLDDYLDKDKSLLKDEKLRKELIKQYVEKKIEQKDKLLANMDMVPKTKNLPTFSEKRREYFNSVYKTNKYASYIDIDNDIRNYINTTINNTNTNTTTATATSSTSTSTNTTSVVSVNKKIKEQHLDLVQQKLERMSNVLTREEYIEIINEMKKMNNDGVSLNERRLVLYGYLYNELKLKFSEIVKVAKVLDPKIKPELIKTIIKITVSSYNEVENYHKKQDSLNVFLEFNMEEIKSYILNPKSVLVVKNNNDNMYINEFTNVEITEENYKDATYSLINYFGNSGYSTAEIIVLIMELINKNNYEFWSYDSLLAFIYDYIIHNNKKFK